MAKKKTHEKTFESIAETNKEDPPTPVVVLPRITARQFVVARGFRWERCAGFLAAMSKEEGDNARKTVSEWVAQLESFWERPVR